MKKRSGAMAAAVAAVIGAISPGARGDLSWDGDGQMPASGGSGQWDLTTPRWVDGVLTTWENSGTSGAVFGPAAGAMTLNVGVNVAGMQFNAPYLVLNPVAGPQAINFNGAINTGSNTVEMLAVLNKGTNAGGLTKTGTGTLVIHGANVYTGATTISTGTLAFANTTTADIPDSSDVVIDAGATLDLSHTGGDINDTIGSLAGGGLVKLGTRTGAMAQVTGSFLQIGGANTTEFSGTISGTGGRLFKAGTGVLKLSGANTYTGRTDVAGGGMLQLAGGAALSDLSTITISGTGSVLELLNDETTGSIGSSSAAVINLNGNKLTLGADNMPVMQFNGAINGTGGIIKVGSGVQQLGSTASTYSGGATVRAGILVVTSDARLGSASGSVTLDGGTLSNFASATTSTPNSHARTFNIGTNGGGVQVLSHDLSVRVVTITGKVTGAGTLTKSGMGNLALSATTNDFAGLTIDEGAVTSAAGSGTPFGRGSIVMNRGRIVSAPGSGTNPNITAATLAGSTVSYGTGSEIQINRGTQTTATLTLGPAGAGANSVLQRIGSGTLLIIPNTGATNLGNIASPNYERLIIQGGVPTVNGIASPSIIVQASAALSSGDFVGYDTIDGFKIATYTSNTVDTAGITDVVKANQTQSISTNRAVYALHTAAYGVGGAFDLTIGNGTGAAGLAMNVGGAISTRSLIFDGSDGVIFTARTAAGAISAPISITGSNGLAKFGSGRLTLNAQSNYSGPTKVGGGIIVIGLENALPTTTHLDLGGVVPIANPVNLTDQVALRLQTFNQTVGALSGQNSYAQIDLGSGTLTVNQSIDTSYYGTISGTAGTFVKMGSGTLVLNPYKGGTVNSAAALPFSANTFGKMQILGGTVAMQDVRTLADPGVQTDDFLTLDGGTFRWDGADVFTSSMTPGAVALGANRGVTLGTNGGTIHISNPLTLVTWQLNNGETDGFNIFNGSGDLIKDGPGTLRLGIGNSNTGRVVLRGGRLQFQNGSSLGTTPVTLRADALVFDGGTAESNGTGVFEDTRGVTVTANGGFTTGGFTYNAPISGSANATLTKVLSAQNDPNHSFNILTLNASSPDFLGTLDVRAGRLDVTADNATGLGTLKLTPNFPVILTKRSGTSNTTLNSAVHLGSGSTIDVRVDGGSVGGLILAGKVSGPGNWYKGTGGSAGAGLGMLTLSNASNDFTGMAIVQTGTLAVTADGALGSTNAATVVVGAGAGTVAGSIAFSGNVNYTKTEALFVSGVGSGGSGVIRNLSGSNRFAGPVTLTGDTTVNAASGTLELAGNVSGASSLTKVGAGKLVLSGASSTWEGDTTVQEGPLDFAATHRINALKLKTATVTTLTTGNRLLRTTSVEFNNPAAPDAVLDLTDGRLVVDYPGTSTASSPIGDIHSAILYAYTNDPTGAWKGNGITSSWAAAAPTSRAIGYAEASRVAPSETWVGENVGTTAVLVRATLVGDADLDGAVNFFDLTALAAHYGEALASTTWADGDFNYDGAVNFFDLTALASNYGLALPSGAVPGASVEFNQDLAAAFASVPEPGGLGLVALWGAAALRRRRRVS